MDINELMEKINEYIKNILDKKYVGVYFHGSLRLGSFNPNKSDLDFIIVSNDKLSFDEKEKICDWMMQHRNEFPKKGFEFSVVLEKYCKEFIYPTPYELHMSVDWESKYLEDKTLVINDKEKFDSDLASHFNVINQKNDDLDFGISSEEIFQIVPKKYVFESNYSDTMECIENIKDNPIYCILNLCRFCAYLKDNITLSKYDGGKWGIHNLDNKYKDIIEIAMNDYISETDSNYDNDNLKEFAEYMSNQIKRFINKE